MGLCDADGVGGVEGVRGFILILEGEAGAGLLEWLEFFQKTLEKRPVILKVSGKFR